MENISILTIDGVEYDHTQIHKLAKMSPEIIVDIKDICVYGTDIDSTQFQIISDETVFNEYYRTGNIVVFKHHNKLILLTGYDKLQSIKESGKEKIQVTLISKPVLKRARLEVYVKSVVLDKPRSNDRNRSQTRINGHLPVDDHMTMKPSRQRNINF